jgi:hypothetical protein
MNGLISYISVRLLGMKSCRFVVAMTGDMSSC